MKKVAVILSGCGVFDGSEIYETVITLLSIERAGASYQCFAPNKKQMHVINHSSGDEAEGESRDVYTEAARLARGEIKPLSKLNADDFDALIIPGGFGAAKNFSDFAVKGPDATPDENMVAACKQFKDAGKVAGYMCIAPTLMPFVYGKGVKLTIGRDKDTAQALEKMGAVHIPCDVDAIVIDETHNVVTTPAYMLAESINEAASGVEALVSEVLKRA